ncbi:transposase [Bdellovibrio sp. HCB290]|uniref:transposase n=1 Tax=Bdellovibrio sp. HCB290 TaxID=3394356 RepID=UPI0039B4B88F
MRQSRQQTFTTIYNNLSYGGTLRRSSKGRGARPLSSKDPIHLVFKVNKFVVKRGLRSPRNFALMTALMKKYSAKFYVGVEQFSIQRDHVHILLRGSRRSRIQSFLRVVAGQFAQTLTDTFTKRREGASVWLYRPFTRVVKGYKGYQTVRNYIQLNEKEALGRPYSKTRLRGLSEEQLRELWT